MGIEAEIHVKESGSVLPYGESASYTNAIICEENMYAWRIDPNTHAAAIFKIPLEHIISLREKNDHSAILLLLNGTTEQMIENGAEYIAQLNQGEIHSQEVFLEEDIHTTLVIKNIPEFQ